MENNPVMFETTNQIYMIYIYISMGVLSGEFFHIYTYYEYMYQ